MNRETLTRGREPAELSSGSQEVNAIRPQVETVPGAQSGQGLQGGPSGGMAGQHSTPKLQNPPVSKGCPCQAAPRTPHKSRRCGHCPRPEHNTRDTVSTHQGCGNREPTGTCPSSPSAAAWSATSRQAQRWPAEAWARPQTPDGPQGCQAHRTHMGPTHPRPPRPGPGRLCHLCWEGSAPQGGT